MKLKIIAACAIPLAMALTAFTGCDRECCCDSECARQSEHAPIKPADHTEPLAKVPVKPTERMKAIWKIENALIDSFLSLSGEVQGGEFDIPAEQFERDSGELKYTVLWQRHGNGSVNPADSGKTADRDKEELVNAQLKVETQNGRWVCVVSAVRGRGSKTFVEALSVYAGRLGVEVIVK